MTPLGNYVIVEITKEKTFSAGGLELLGDVDTQTTTTKVVSVGRGIYQEGVLVPMEVSKGDTIIYTKSSGLPLKLDGIEYRMIKETDILVIVK